MTLAELKDDILVFDIDGTLTKYDFPEFKIADKNEWVPLNIKRNVYTDAKPIHLFDELLESKNSSDLYILSVAFSSFEQNNKLDMLERLFPMFREDNIFFVAHDQFKVYILQYLRELYDKEGKEHKRIVLIEDNVNIMSSIENLRNKRIKCYLLSDFL